MNIINLNIDGKNIKAEATKTILNVATENGIKIPNLCYDGRTELYGACGLCLIEIEGNAKLLRACSTRVSEGMVVKTNSERIGRARKTALELLLSDHTGDCKAPCTLACPANTDCQGYVSLIANGEYKEAVKLIKEKIPFPSSIGRVCPHPCEKKCRRQYVDEPISIANLKSFVGDMDMLSEDNFEPSVEPDTGKTVAIVGGGPAGLTAAFFLRRMGHAVTVFDAMPKMGGMLRYGIPEYRLPKAILDKEISQIEKLSIELKNNIKIGKDITLNQLKEKYDAVVVAAGAWNSSKMRVDGENLDGVFGGIDFLREVSLGNAPKIGKRVAVVGGGNTAMDACRTAKRLGADEVYIIYRRTLDEMPAEKLEIDEAKEEGIIYKFLTNPIKFTGNNGRINAAVLQKMELGKPDESGRRSPVPIDGEIETIELDSVIMAIGQHPNLDGFEQLEATKRHTISADENSFRTSVDGVFAIGDITNKGADIAISAIGEAQKSAVIIDRYLNGENVSYKKPFFVENEIPLDFYKKFGKQKRAVMPTLDAKIRSKNFKEVALGFSESTAKKEAMRCLECGCHDFFECKLIEYSNDYDVKLEKFKGEKHNRENEDVNSFIIRNTNKCILCGLCVRVCEETMGTVNLGLIGRGFDTVVMPELSLPLEESSCTFCGQCVAVCPTGALIEKQPSVKRLTVKENSVQSVCNFCNALCKTDIRYIGNTVIKSLPFGENGILCKGGKFGIFAATQNAKPINSVIEVKNQLKKYKSDEIAFIAGSTTTFEEASLINKISKNLYTTANEFSAGYVGLEHFNAKTSFDNFNFKAVILVEAELPTEVKNQEYVVSINCEKNDDANSNIIVSPFIAKNGTYITKEKEYAELNKVACFDLPNTKTVLAELFDTNFDYIKLNGYCEKVKIDKETIKSGGNFKKIQDNKTINKFKKMF
ncbi:MAG: NAD(P)-binding protein [Oscillospiraceae bacterium]